jgi:hypothetical protein
MANRSDYDDVEELEIGDEFSTTIETNNPRVKNYKPGGNLKL